MHFSVPFNTTPSQNIRKPDIPRSVKEMVSRAVRERGRDVASQSASGQDGERSPDGENNNRVCIIGLQLGCGWVHDLRCHMVVIKMGSFGQIWPFKDTRQQIGGSNWARILLWMLASTWWSGARVPRGVSRLSRNLFTFDKVHAMNSTLPAPFFVVLRLFKRTHWLVTFAVNVSGFFWERFGYFYDWADLNWWSSLRYNRRFERILYHEEGEGDVGETAQESFHKTDGNRCCRFKNVGNNTKCTNGEWNGTKEHHPTAFSFMPYAAS